MANIDQLIPVVSPRQCGGWLAVAPRGLGIALGVTAETQIEAEARFRVAVRDWTRILSAAD